MKNNLIYLIKISDESMKFLTDVSNIELFSKKSDSSYFKLDFDNDEYSILSFYEMMTTKNKLIIIELQELKEFFKVKNREKYINELIN